MELVGILLYGKKEIFAIASDDSEYKLFSSRSDGSVNPRNSFRKNDYTSHENFALSYGKFEPYVHFLEKPVEIADAKFDTLKAALKGIKLPDFIIAEE